MLELPFQAPHTIQCRNFRGLPKKRKQWPLPWFLLSNWEILWWLSGAIICHPQVSDISLYVLDWSPLLPKIIICVFVVFFWVGRWWGASQKWILLFEFDSKSNLPFLILKQQSQDATQLKIKPGFKPTTNHQNQQHLRLLQMEGQCQRKQIMYPTDFVCWSVDYKKYNNKKQQQIQHQK